MIDINLIRNDPDAVRENMRRKFQERPHRFRFRVEFAVVAAPELLPAGGGVAEPFPERRRGRRLPEPQLRAQFFFGYAPGPHPVDQHTGPVGFFDGGVHALRTNIQGCHASFLETIMPRTGDQGKGFSPARAAARGTRAVGAGRR